MFTRNCLTLAGLLLGTVGYAAGDSPRLGEPIDAKTLSRLDYTILPDGNGLPGGVGTASQGAIVYERHCVACHGEGGSGGINDALVGGQGSLGAESPVKTVGSFWPYATTIFDYVRRAMPLQSPGILSDEEVYSVTAYLLYLNGIIDEDAILSSESLPRVEMPNRDGFVRGYP